MAPNRIIIDTDPGVDDVLAMLLAFSAKPEELEVLMLSITFGNVDVQNCLRNIVTLFHYIEKEKTWRRDNGRPEGFEGLKNKKPVVAVGATEPLAEQMMVADFYHGRDGLGGIHDTHPHLSPAETWRSLFKPPPESMTPSEAAELQKAKEAHSLFEPSLNYAPDEMLRLLKENEPNTIIIVAIGPLTNLAIASAKDPETFLRVKEVVVMGGAVDVPGNPPNLARVYSPKMLSIPVPNFNLIKQPNTPLRRELNLRNQMTPGAEFNTYADSVASARLFALTSPNPSTTMPPTLGGDPKSALQDYPKKLSTQLKLKLFPLDITTPHLLPRQLFNAHAQSLPTSPLNSWASHFLTSTYEKVFSLKPDQDPAKVGLEMHDPLTVWYALTSSAPEWKFVEEDIRVETAGQWTRGTCIVDRRGKVIEAKDGDDVDAEIVGDAGGWMDARWGNRILRCVGTPGEDKFAGVLLQRVFGAGL